MSIRIPGLEGIDIDEILGRASTIPRPPLNKKRPLPRPPFNQERPIDSPVISEGFPGGIGSVEISETINIPGVGPIQLPMPQSPATTEADPREFEDKVFGPKIDPNASELDKLKAQYDHLSGRRFFRDPGPEHWNKIKELAQQIYSLDNTFESPYLETPEQGRMKKPRPGDGDVIYDENPVIGTRPDGTPVRLYDKDSADYLDKQKTNQSPVFDENESTRTGPIETTTQQTPTGSYESNYIDWLESKPQPPTIPKAGRSPGGGPAYKKAQEKYQKDLATWEGSKPTRDSFTQESQSSAPVETKSGEGPKPGTGFGDGRPAPPPPPSFEGYVPRNILGASFDPKDLSAQQKMVADARARQTPGANIQGGGYLTYDNPMLGNKQTQFGGYGQPMPTAPLMNYAGLSSPITYSVPDPDPDKEPGGPPPPPPIFT